jgi:outer membrane biosynthesis protein TonB
MTRATTPVLALVAGLATALALTSCGGEDAQLLPGETAQEIDENLDSVRVLAEAGECLAAEDAALQVSTQVEALGGIDPELKRALGEGTDRLNEVVSRCEEPQEDTVEDETAPETTESTDEKSDKKDKKEKEKKKDKAEKEAPDETAEPEPEEPSLPPQSNGKAKGHDKGPSEEEGDSQSGGIGPGAAAESE